ncbi:hypothetical protein GQ473_07335 [archaeon]|nr:hypothetical protein [archaeon]
MGKIKKTLKLKTDGNIEFPKEFIGCKRYVVTMPYSKCIVNRLSLTTYFRAKGKDKPYINEGHVSFKPFGKKETIFRVIDENGKQVK